MTKSCKVSKLQYTWRDTWCLGRRVSRLDSCFPTSPSNLESCHLRHDEWISPSLHLLWTKAPVWGPLRRADHWGSKWANSGELDSRCFVLACSSHLFFSQLLVDPLKTDPRIHVALKLLIGGIPSTRRKPISSKQPSILELAVLGIKVRDFAHESTLLPLPSVCLRLRRIQNERACSFVRGRKLERTPTEPDLESCDQVVGLKRAHAQLDLGLPPRF